MCSVVVFLIFTDIRQLDSKNPRKSVLLEVELSFEKCELFETHFTRLVIPNTQRGINGTTEVRQGP